MIVAKYGGTCITNNNISKVKHTLTEHHGVIVVSAVGKSSANDIKVTDLLIQLHNSLPNTQLWQAIANKYRQIVRSHAIDIDIDLILDDALCRILHNNYYNYTLSIGEELSAIIMSRYLGLKYLDAEKVIIFDHKGKISLSKTKRALHKYTNAKEKYCLAGFWGSNGQRVLFDRGGSDITGAVVASCLDASLYENWTDVNGVCVASPHVVNNSATVSALSYADMQVLSNSGANVLQSQSIYPLYSKAIPINIRNIYNIAHSGTVVSSCCNSQQILGITDCRQEDRYVTTIVSSYPLDKVLSAVVDCLVKHNIAILGISASNTVVTIESFERVVEVIYQQFLTLQLL